MLLFVILEQERRNIIYFALSIMVSEKTLKWTIWIIRIGSFLKVFPAIWVPQENCMKPNFGKNTLISFSNKNFGWSINVGIGKLLQVTYLLLHISCSAYLINLLVFREHNRTDFYLSVILLFILGMSLVAQINFYYWSDDIFRVFNSILVLDTRLRKY